MKRWLFVLALAVLTALPLAACQAPPPITQVEAPTGQEGAASAPAEEKVNLIYMTAGDVNMLALGQNVLAPEFEAMHPNVDVSVVHTGPGDAGSRLIFEKLKADKDSGKDPGDVDVVMVHQKFMDWAMAEDLLMPYAKDTSTWQYVTAEDARNALGTDIEGYAIPMFHSQTALAYDPDCVSDPPTSYAELVTWVKENPGKFGYNGIKGGMSGVSFTVGWLYWATDKYDKYAVTGPFEEDEIASWDQPLQDMKAFNDYVTFTAGNVGTLDALNRGEICIGPVWVDMFYTFMAEGKLDPSVRLILPDPGMPGQPMYFVIPANAPHPEAAKQWIEYATSPEVQGKVIIEQYNWYPGIDGKFVQDVAPPEAFDRLYADITPEELSQKGESFPKVEYFDAMLEAYEQNVTGG